MLGVMLLTTGVARAQVRDVGRGSTVRGDIPRGEGVFLQGTSWYDLNETKAMSISGFEGVDLPGSILGPCEANRKLFLSPFGAKEFLPG
jgi:hypothetical protein